MEIHAKCKADLRAAKAAVKELGRTKRIVFTAIYSALVLYAAYYVLTIDVMVYKRATDNTVWFVFALVMLIAFIVLTLTEPRRAYNRLGKRRDKEQNFTFRDDDFDAYITEPGLDTRTTISYDCLERVIETPEFLFLLYSKRTGAQVDKATLEGGTAEQLAERLRAAVPEGKYTVRKR